MAVFRVEDKNDLILVRIVSAAASVAQHGLCFHYLPCMVKIKCNNGMRARSRCMHKARACSACPHCSKTGQSSPLNAALTDVHLPHQYIDGRAGKLLAWPEMHQVTSLHCRMRLYWKMLDVLAQLRACFLSSQEQRCWCSTVLHKQAGPHNSMMYCTCMLSSSTQA